MKDSVAAAFPEFTARFEGHLDFMYADVLGLVTTGVGNLIDPMALAAGLPWVHKSDGSPATTAEVVAEWQLVKGRKDLDKHGGAAFGAITRLRLTPASIDDLVANRMKTNGRFIRTWCRGYDDLCADAQLGIHSMAWAMGPGFNVKFPTFVQALVAGDFLLASLQCKMNEAGNPGLAPRNVANLKLFENAAAVSANGADPEALYYPGDVPGADDVA